MPNPDVDSPTRSPFVNLNHQTSSSSKRKPGVGVVNFDSPPRRRVSVNSHGPRHGSTLAIEWVGDGDDNRNDTVGVNVPDDDDNAGNGSGTVTPERPISLSPLQCRRTWHIFVNLSNRFLISGIRHSRLFSPSCAIYINGVYRVS